MPTLSECPSQEVLQRMMLGQIAQEEADALEGHLLTCPRCTQVLQGLSAEDGLVEAMRQARTMPPPPEAADALIPWLKRLRPKDVIQTLAVSDSTASTPDPLTPLPLFDFLEQPQKPDEVGRLGKYRVLQSIGVGGMGMVFLAEDQMLKRQVALKIIKPDLLHRADLRKRFLSEARAIAAVEHDNIVSIYEANDVRGVPYLVMPLLYGESLEDHLRKRNAPLPIDDILGISQEIAAGLAAAHDCGMIHRDIKPSNIWLEERYSIGASSADQKAITLSSSKRRVKILDFGLARTVESLDEEGHQRTILGTPAYMSPEQGRCLPVDARSDLFSLGCVIYRMATGQIPFQGKDVVTTLLSIATEEPRPVRQLNPKLPKELVAVIDKLLAKKPQERYSSAHEVVDVLQQIKRKRQPHARTRWWLGITAACVVVAVLATLAGSLLWQFLENRPCEVTFEYGGPDAVLVLQHGDDPEQEIDVKQTPRQMLVPGTYVVRPKKPVKERRLEPDHFVVNSREPQVVLLKLVSTVEACEVTFAYDEPDARIIVQREDEPEHEFDVRQTPRQMLLPGQYLVRPKKPQEHRQIFPGDFVLQPRQAKRVDLQLVGLIRPYDGHSQTIWAVAFSPRKDSFLALTASNDHDVGMWNTQSGEAAVWLHGHESPVRCLTISADGKRALSGCGKPGPLKRTDLSVRLWDLDNRSPIATLTGHGSWVTAVAFDPGGKTLMSGDMDGVLIVWDAATHQRLKSIEAHKSRVYAIAHLPGGKQFLTCSIDKELVLWDAEKHVRLKRFEGHQGAVTCISVAPNGTEAASSCADGQIRIWNLQSGQCRVLAGHEKAVYGIAYSPDGKRLLSGGEDGIVRLWDAATGESILRFYGHNKAVHGVAFSPDGRRAISGGADRVLRLWELPR